MLYSYEVLIRCDFLPQLNRQRWLASVGRLPQLRILIPRLEVLTRRVLHIRMLDPNRDLDTRDLQTEN